jgi:hypothetical protein
MSPENVTLAMYRVGSMKRRDELPSCLGKLAEVHGSMPPHIALHLQSLVKSFFRQVN